MRQLPCTHYPGWLAGWCPHDDDAGGVVCEQKTSSIYPETIFWYLSYIAHTCLSVSATAAASNNKPESINVGSRHDIPSTRYPPPPPIPVPRNSPWEWREAATWANHTGHTTIYYLIYFAGGVDYCCCCSVLIRAGNFLVQPFAGLGFNGSVLLLLLLLLLRSVGLVYVALWADRCVLFSPLCVLLITFISAAATRRHLANIVVVSV